MHNSVCLDFDGGSSSKARLDTRITKVGQTNIDELLLDFFWRRVNFLLSPSAFVVGGPMAARWLRRQLDGGSDGENRAERQLLKMQRKSRHAGNHLGIGAF
ncbi:hypothetical protein [Mesorhizobium sp.]|uniref:hypothetical protein n=1 Tax=Mesorhizobium sp. TaxID=1871066 RepID=UPI000FE850D8|nr:hypothetical protein [Mesorhizobium sp.]RWP94390.1 MAG: hypothetical protein EOR89_30460 [Mesorhizobium sp.]RWQ51585.1 MAG: hypothetical protein EOS82_12585 [Mesorhizobium sp.]